MSDWTDKSEYTPNYFSWQESGSRRSAQAIVPLVVSLIQPKSVVEFGCGTGSWLAEFKHLGSSEILGVDGQYIEKSGLLRIPSQNFLARDLNSPVSLSHRFDLAVALEVAEHLRPTSAWTFVKSLTEASPVVLFSAAIPFQGGPKHLNEQWPNYWAKMFKQFAYPVFDVIRKQIWTNIQIEWWYRQNIFLFIHRNHLSHNPDLRRRLGPATPQPLSLVHPDCFVESISVCPPEIYRQKRYS